MRHSAEGHQRAQVRRRLADFAGAQTPPQPFLRHDPAPENGFLRAAAQSRRVFR